jgi:anti-sigma regulatory factor (Ser/Thr protein kinase)
MAKRRCIPLEPGHILGEWANRRREAEQVETEAWVRSAFQELTALPGVLRTGVALTDGGGRQLLFTASDRDSQHVEWCEVDAYEDVPLNNAVRTGKLVVGPLADLSARYPEFVARQARDVRGVASVPLSADGEILGGFVLFYAAPQPFDAPQLDRLRGLGEKLGEELRRPQRGGTLRGRSLASEPVPVGARAATHVIAGAPDEVHLARQFVRSTLAAWGIDGDTLHTAVLCVRELVTNAIIHTKAGCEIRVLLHDGVLTAQVRDAGPAVARPDTSRRDPLAVRGRGLQLVEALSARWGSELDPRGMTVWCELAVA